MAPWVVSRAPGCSELAVDGGPRVRISLPPAASHQRTPRQSHRQGRGDSASGRSHPFWRAGGVGARQSTQGRRRGLEALILHHRLMGVEPDFVIAAPQRLGLRECEQPPAQP
jgi:hypothetical protein